MRCPRCGAWVEDDRTRCTRCGAPVASAAMRSKSRQRVEGDARRDSGYDSGSRGAHQERQSYGHASDSWDSRSDSQNRDGEVPFRPVYQPPEPKKPKIGLIVAIVAIIAVVLIVLFVWPGVVKGCSSDTGGQTTSAQGSGAGDTSAETSTSSGAFSASKAEAAARDAAKDAGKQVFSGTVRVAKVSELAEEAGVDLSGDFPLSSDEEIVVLELAGSPSIEARSAADNGTLVTRPKGKSLRLDNSYSSLNGQKVSIAVHAADMTYPDDATSGLYTVTTENATVIAPLTASTAQKAIEAAGTIGESTRANIASAEEAATQKKAEEEEARQQAEQEAQWQAEQQAQQQYANNYYIIPDSSSRYLSRSELEGYSTYDLYLARNEIYARYGRLFVNQDLQDYFWSQAWYNGYIAPDSFDASWMSDVDRQNATLMRQIEEERNSPYL